MSKKDSEMSTTAEPKAPKSPREDDKKDKKDKRKAAADDKASKGSSTTEIKATNNSDTPSLDRKQESRLDLKTVVYGTGKSFENCVINHSKLVNERVYTDIVFVVETKQIKAHKSIIQARCPNLVKKSVKKLTEGKGFKRIDLNEKDHITEDALTRVLVYLYSGQVDWSTISQIQVVHLINAAVVYELERLAQLCERYLQEHLTLDEAYTLLKESHDLNIERAKKIVFYYALDHYTQFIANARAKELGIDLFQELSIKNVDPESKQIIESLKVLREITEKDTIIEDFRKLYETSDNSDVTFLIENKHIKCHRAILADASSSFEPLWEGDKIRKPIPLDEKKFPTFSAEAFHAMLKFIYFSDEKIDPLPATELIIFAKEFNLPKLLRVCEDIIRRGIAVNTVLAILHVSYTMSDKPDLRKELKTNCLEFLVTHLDQVKLDPLAKMDARIAADILLAVQMEIGNRWKIDASVSSKITSKEKHRENHKTSSLRSVKGGEESGSKADETHHTPKEEVKSESSDHKSAAQTEEKKSDEAAEPVADLTTTHHSDTPKGETKRESTDKKPEPSSKDKKEKEKHKRDKKDKKDKKSEAPKV
jgi:hypothetical protein